MPSSHPMTLEGLQGPELPTSSSATVIDSRHLAVEIQGAPTSIHLLALRLAQGGLTVQFRGVRLVLTHFTVFNQEDRGRLVFTAAHRPATGFATPEKL